VNKPPIASLMIGAGLVNFIQGKPLFPSAGSLMDRPARTPRPRCDAVLRADDWDFEISCELTAGHGGKHDYLGWIE
jgi:hypothetical protein